MLTVTQMLRKKGVVDKFVEFFGPGLDNMSLPDRATIANMAPEYGATMGFFPVDAETLRYMRLTGRPGGGRSPDGSLLPRPGTVPRAEHARPGIHRHARARPGSVVPSLAGPKRPQDRVALTDMKGLPQGALTAPVKERGFELSAGSVEREATFGTNGGSHARSSHGAVVIAAITSCTNTCNPSVMVAAGLVAKKAVEKG